MTEIRPAQQGDLAAVAAIYNVEVEQGTGTFDTEPKLPGHFAHRLAPGAAGDVFLVATEARSPSWAGRISVTGAMLGP